MKIWTKLSPDTQSSERGMARRDALPRGQADSRMVVGFAGGGGGYMAAPRTRMSILRRHPFSFAVLLPTFLIALYFFAIATPQYVSEAQFVLRNQSAPSPAGGLAGLMGGAGGIATVSDEERAVAAYLISHDAVTALRGQVDLVRIFRPEGADALSRLWWQSPTAERLRDHFRSQVKVIPDAYTGIVTMTVRTYSPEDSLRLSRLLLELGERRTLEMNQRMLEETLRVSREEVERAEGRMARAQEAITEFRQREQALNPSRSAELTVGSIAGLENEAARMRTELQQLQAFARPNAPQVQALRERIRATEQQIQEERARAAGASQGVTRQMAGFERLQMEAEFAGRVLAAAVAGFEQATTNAQRQQIFLQRIVEPNLAERSLYPRPVLFTLYAFAGLSLVYGLLWLVVAGVREHAI